jgi:Mn2+/Fe2+ NRAMP family transporter
MSMSEQKSEPGSHERFDSKPRDLLRSFGLGIITGAADDDCSAVGTYSQAGASFGYTLLWTVPYLLPMMVTVVYLSSKLGQAREKGFFRQFAATIRAGCFISC